MIYSKLENLSVYLSTEIYTEVEKFLNQVCADMPEGKYPILGEKVFARVMSYDTKEPEICRIEAHDRYIDIQATIAGAEGIGVYDRKALTEADLYNEEKDVIHYVKKGAEQIAYTVNVPGYFTLLYPEDAHSPQEKVLSFNQVKKFVIKVQM